jgi:hypothetical protein
MVPKGESGRDLRPRKYARDKGIKPFPTKKPARIQALIARDDADVAELNAMIRDGSIEGGVKNYLSDKAPTAPTSTDVQQAAEQLRQTAAQSPPTGQPAPQPEDESITYSQPATNPADDAPPSGVPAAQQADVEETALVQQATSQILEQSGLNSLELTHWSVGLGIVFAPKNCVFGHHLAFRQRQIATGETWDRFGAPLRPALPQRGESSSRRM